MSLIKTDWVCVLQAGKTVDGRTITEQMIDDMVETYDEDVYNARINIDHQIWGMKLGDVEELKSEVVNGVKKMYAVLCPNEYFLTLIQSGQKLHTSVEIQPDFAGTGKYYLIGLALTDSPASLGTTELQLSNNGNSVQVFSTSEVIELPIKQEHSILSLFKKEPEKMDKDTAVLLSQLSQQMNQTAQLLSSAEQKFSAHLSHSVPPNNDANPDEVAQLTAEVSALKLELSELKTAMSKISDEPNRALATGTNAPEELGAL